MARAVFRWGPAFLLGLPVFVVMAGLAMTFFLAGTPIASLPNETLGSSPIRSCRRFRC